MLLKKIFHPIIKGQRSMLLNQNLHTVCNREYQKSRNLRCLFEQDAILFSAFSYVHTN